MCSPTGFQDVAKNEKDAIVYSGTCSLIQEAVLESAWAKAVVACVKQQFTTLPGIGASSANYAVRYIDVDSWTIKGRAVGRVAAAVYKHGGSSCMNVLAADLKASPWWHGSAPQTRAQALASNLSP
jgi:hypothetical protein